MKKMLRWLFWELSGIRAIYELIRPPTEEEKKRTRPAPTIVLWLGGIHTALFGIATANYTDFLDRVEMRAGSVIALVAEEDLRADAFGQLVVVQHQQIPRKPRFFSLFLPSLWQKVPYLEGIKLMKGVVVASKRKLEKAQLKEALLFQADLRGALMRGVNLSGAHLQEAVLVRADLTQGYLRACHLNGANLTQAKLMDANLISADLYKADLFMADLRGVTLEGANLQFARLQGANFAGAHLEGADLRHSDITFEQLMSAFFNAKTRLPADIQHQIEALKTSPHHALARKCMVR